MLWLKVLALFLAGFSNILIASLVLLRGGRRLNNISFFGLALGMAGWSVGIAFFLLSDDPRLAFFWAKLYYFFPLLIALSLVVFVRTFPENRRVPHPLGWATAVIFTGLSLLLILLPQFLTSKLIYHSWGKEIVLDPFHYLIYSIFLLIAYPGSLMYIYLRYHKGHGLYARQAELFSVGFFIALIFGVFFNLVLPWFGNYRLIWLGPLFTSAFMIAVAYSIIKHRMFDIRLVVARSLGYLLSIVSLSLLYGLLTFTVINRFVFRDQATSISQEIAFTIIAALLAITFYPVRKFFDKITNRLFYRDAYDPQGLIDSLNKTLVANIEMDRILYDTAQIIKKNLKSEFCIFELKATEFSPQRVIGTNTMRFSAKDIQAVRKVTPLFDQNVIIVDYLDGGYEQLKRILQRNNIAVLVRLASPNKHHEEGLGYLVLGPKQSGNPYSQQDAKILDIISRELLLAIQNVLRFEEIQSFNITLQARIEEATRKLRRTNEKLRQLDQTKDDFISMASHQLRTPLTSVKGYVSMVLDGDAGPVSPLQRKLLSQSYISSQRMVYLISDLLNVSRLRTGKFVIEPVPCNLAKVIKDEIEQLQETAKGRNLELTYNKPEHFPTLMLDETKIRQVIMNFIDNAIYYTPSGGHIRVSLVDKPETVEFTVVDDGMGVNKHEQHHLFTKFFRAQNAQRARPDGTGLGLFMAKKVVVAQGGAIIFKSREGKGSTFGFSFAKKQLSPETPPGLPKTE